jgi:hypothetical protein
MKIECDVCEFIFNALCINKTLNTLNLSGIHSSTFTKGNNIQSDGCFQIFEGLKINKHLMYLDLRCIQYLLIFKLTALIMKDVK